MLLSDIYKTACAYICEDSDGSNAAELRANAPSLAAGIITEHIFLDRLLTGKPSDGYPEMKEYSSFDSVFPLSERLVPLCALKLASLLCADENEYLSDRLNGEYEVSRERFLRSLPADIAPITDVYR